MPLSDGLISARQLCSNSVDNRVIAPDAITDTEIAVGFAFVELVTTLPVSGNFEGRMVYLTTDDKLYRHDGSAFLLAVDGADIEDGTIVASDKIVANTITSSEIFANTITAGEIQAGAIGASELAAINIGVGKHIRSTIYTAGSAGWAIDADGTAEFDSIIARGEIEAQTGILTTLTIDGSLTMASGGILRTGPTGSNERMEFGFDNSFFDMYSAAGVLVATAGYLSAFTALILESKGNASLNLISDSSMSITSDSNMTFQTSDASSGISYRAGTNGSPGIHEFFKGTTGLLVTLGTGAMLLADSYDLEMDGANLTLMDGTANPNLRWTDSSKSTNRKYEMFRDDSDFDTWIFTHTDSGGSGKEVFSVVDHSIDSHTIRDDTNTGTPNVLINSTTGRLERDTSAARYKTDIGDIDLTGIRLRPRVFTVIKTGMRQIGFIADEVAAEVPSAGDYANGEIENYSKAAVSAILASQLNDLLDRVAVLEAA